MITAKQRLATPVKHTNIFITLAIYSILIISCSDDEVGKKTDPKYEAEHVLIIDNVEASGFGAAGENTIELIFQDQVSFDSGIILDKLSGSWKELKSLYTGSLRSGTKVSFQNESVGFLVQNNVYYVANKKLLETSKLFKNQE